MRIPYEQLQFARPENLARLARSLGLRNCRYRTANEFAGLVRRVYLALEQDRVEAAAEKFRELKQWIQDRK